MELIASDLGWKRTLIRTSDFALSAYVPKDSRKSRLLAIYIEGDGLAWISSSQPSSNPTPLKAVGLQLALRHPSGAVAYLGRPCQGIEESDWGKCNASFWTSHRFSQEVIAATNDAIDQLKARVKADSIVLIGFSGGGTVAALVSANRSDVVHLVTVAGNLDTDAWVAHHKVDPLTGSLNPAAYTSKLASISQIHFVGADDRVIPPHLVTNFVSRFNARQRPVVRVMLGFDHQCCWADAWPRLIHETGIDRVSP